ncbi:MAG: CPBP family intramembrane metalloprotease [Acidobacteriota bacterium]
MDPWGKLEVGLALLLGAANVVTDAAGWGRALVMGSGAVLWGGCLAWRLLGQPNLSRAWGFRRDNAGAAARLLAPVVVPLAAVMIAVGWWLGHFPLPAEAWTLLGYPLWGTVQQFFLNAMVFRNLERWLGGPRAMALAATLFAASHAPDWPLVALTLPAGLLFTWGYRRHPNLWVLGLAHGALGALAWSVLLGRHPLQNLGMFAAAAGRPR